MSPVASGGSVHPEGSGDPSSDPRNTAQSCRQCRARKVKCDRRSTGCFRCEKVDLPCSYTVQRSPDTEAQRSLENETNPGSDLTEAGTKRRRTRRACAACRKTKARCSGTQPCSKCVLTRAHCTYDGDAVVRQSGHPGQTSVPLGYTTSSGISSQSLRCSIVHGASASSASPFDTPSITGTVAAASSRASFHWLQASDVDLTKKDTVRRCLDAYFANLDLVDCPFLHKATVIAEWNRDALDPTLIQAICAHGLRLQVDGQEEEGSMSRIWMDNVRTTLSSRRWSSTIPSLQALMLLVKFMFTCSFTEEIWVLLSIAARLAFIQRLNYENAKGDAIKQECLRRLMWSIFFHDKLFCGGIEDLSVCPTHRLQIRLPSNDYCFQRGLRSRSQFLKPDPTANSSDMDATAYRLRLLDLRDRILQYTKLVIRDDKSPITSRHELQALDDELRLFRDSLPSELHLNPERLTVMCHSPEATSYITLHTMLLLCRCDLHRFLVPGIREAVSTTALAATPSDFVTYCQQACLDGALALCDFFSELEALDMGRIIDTPNLTITLYQIIKIIGRMTSMLPESGPYSIEELKRKMLQGLSLCRPLQSRVAWLKPCIIAIERLIPQLGNQYRTSSRSPTSDGQEDTSGHVRSKYVFAPQSKMSQEETAAGYRNQVSSATPLVSDALEGDAAMRSVQPWTAPTTAGLDTSTGWQMQENLAFGSHVSRDSYLEGVDEAELISPLSFCDLGLFAYSDAEFVPPGLPDFES